MVIKSITNDNVDLNSTKTPDALKRVLTDQRGCGPDTPKSPLKNMTLNLKEANKVPRKSIDTTSTVNNLSFKEDDISSDGK